MTVGVIDYGAGNLNSVCKALRHIGGDREIALVRNGNDLGRFRHIVLPGVGAFAACMQGLSALPGMIPALEQQVLEQKKPFLGICVGMQMLFDSSEEHGIHKGLGWIKGEVVAMDKGIRDTGKGISTKKAYPVPRIPYPLKIPHMGWNDLHLHQPQHPLLQGIHEGDHAYFVHSYHCVPQDPSVILATVEYGAPITAAVTQGNIMATQFHPEKSQQTGLRLLQNFLQLHPA